MSWKSAKRPLQRGYGGCGARFHSADRLIGHPAWKVESADPCPDGRFDGNKRYFKIRLLNFVVDHFKLTLVLVIPHSYLLYLYI